MATPQIYLVSVWHLAGATPAFEARVRAVEQERAASFTDPGSLVAFFAAGTGDPPPTLQEISDDDTTP